jgi:transcriptional regulator with XRE-family HTH domain
MQRLMLDMTQSELGRQIGVTFQQIQKYEKGVNRVGASRLQHIAKVLGVSVSFFFEGIIPEGTKAPSDANEANRLMTTRDGLSLAQNFLRIKSVQVRRRIVALAQDLASSQS